MEEGVIVAVWFLLGGLLASALIFFVAGVKAWKMIDQEQLGVKALRFAEAAHNLCGVIQDHDTLQDKFIVGLAGRLDSLECRMDQYDKEE